MTVVRRCWIGAILFRRLVRRTAGTLVASVLAVASVPAGASAGGDVSSEPSAGTEAPVSLGGSLTTEEVSSQRASKSSRGSPDSSGEGEPGATVQRGAYAKTPSSSVPRSVAGHRMVVIGVALVSASLVGYVLLAVGLGLANSADSRIRTLTAPSEQDERDEQIRRRDTGNRLAIGAGVSAVALMAAGIPLIVVGRRRAIAATTRQHTIGVFHTPGGGGVRWRVAF